MSDAISSIRVNGKNIATPGGYTEVNTTQTQEPGLVEGGVVAIVGPAVGGEPQKILSFDTLDDVQGYFTEVDDGRNMGCKARLLFNASKDDKISGSPQRLLIVKTNVDTKAGVTLAGALGDLIALQSKDWGAITNQINVSVAPGTNGGTYLTIKKGTVIESGDDIAAAANFTLRSDIANLMAFTVTFDADGLSGLFTKEVAGELTDEIALGLTAGILRVSSDSAADTYQKITFYGINGAGNPAAETVSLDGLTLVSGVASWTAVTGARINGLTVGTITVVDSVGFTVTAFAPTLLAAMQAGQFKVSSDDVTDVGMIVTLYGTDASTGGVISEAVVLAGTTEVEPTKSFATLLKVQITGTTAGIVTVADAASTPLVAIAADTNPSAGMDNKRGMFTNTLIPVTGRISVQAAGVFSVVVRGIDANGAATAELISGDNETKITDNSFQRFDQLEMGNTGAGVDVRWTAKAFLYGPTKTLGEVADLLSDLGFTAASYNDDRLIGDMDLAAGVNINGALGEFYSQTVDVVDWINDNSALVTATRVDGGSGLPLATATPVFLIGGTTAVTSVQNYMTAIDLLKGVGVQTICLLTDNAAVHAYLDAHCRWGQGKGATRRMGYVGLPPDKTEDELDALTAALNSEWLSPVFQNVKVFDDLGALWEAPPYVLALIAAGMDSSAEVGTPLTFKYLNGIEVTHSIINVDVRKESLVRKGLMFALNIKGKGVRWNRGITCYRKRANRILTEHSAMRSLNWCVEDLETFLEEKLTGEPNVLIPASVVKDMAAKRASEQVAGKRSAAWRNINVQKSGDTTIVNIELAPVEPNNFTKIGMSIFSKADAA